MKIKLIKGRHLTAHDKKIIAACVQYNSKAAHYKSTKKTVETAQMDDGNFAVIITTPYSDDWGRPQKSKMHAIVQALV